MRFSGVARMIAASAIFSLMAALVKYAAPRIPTFELVAVRSVLPIPFLIWMIRRRGLSIVARNRRLILLRAVAGILAMSLFFWALGQLPIGDTLLLGRSQPVLVALLAPLFLGERLTRATWFSLVISITGVVLILQPTLNVGNLAGLAVVGGAMASAVAHIVVRRLSADDDPMVIVLNFTVLTALVALPLTVPVAVMPGPVDALALVGIAVLATAGQLLMTGAYAIEQAPVVAAASYVAVAFGVLWGFLFWHEIPVAPVWIGGALVVGAGLLLLWSRRMQPPRAYAPLNAGANDEIV